MNLCFLRSQTFKTGIHRHGWNRVLQELINKYHHDEASVGVDDFLEFSFFSHDSKIRSVFPYDFKWVGFVHHPCNVSFPFDVKYGTPALFAQKDFQDSLANCVGLFTLSERLREDCKVLLDKTQYKHIKINSLKYPTDLSQKQFSYKAFEKEKKVVCLGWWLRKFESLFKLQTSMPKFFCLGSSEWAKGQYNLCMKLYKEKRDSLYKIKLPEPDATIMPTLSNDNYDNMLASSVVFLDLIDTSANTSIIECIASSTPVLVNPLPAVIEYLGPKYPFYYDSIEEASQKINNKELIIETHEYLLAMDKSNFKYSTFISNFGKMIIN